jgi:putative transposase
VDGTEAALFASGQLLLQGQAAGAQRTGWFLYGLPNEALLTSLHHVRATLADWRQDYNTERPYSRLGWKTPDEFAQTFAPQWGLKLRNPQSSAPAPVAQPAQMARTQTRNLAHAE